VPEERSQVERREAVARPGAHELAVAGQELLDAPRVPDRRRLADVELRPGLEQRLEDLVTTGVASAQHRRDPGSRPAALGSAATALDLPNAYQWGFFRVRSAKDDQLKECCLQRLL